MSQVIALINFKGGVGKTANTVNLGACLAEDHNKRVLIVDLDPQCNATFWLLPPKNWRARIEDTTRTVAQIFYDRMHGTKKFSFSKAVIKGVPMSESDIGLNAKLDLLPASLDLIEIEDLLHEQSKRPFFTFFGMLWLRFARSTITSCWTVHRIFSWWPRTLSFSLIRMSSHISPIIFLYRD
jgi:chromosome partitioning protein